MLVESISPTPILDRVAPELLSYGIIAADGSCRLLCKEYLPAFGHDNSVGSGGSAVGQNGNHDDIQLLGFRIDADQLVWKDSAPDDSVSSDRQAMGTCRCDLDGIFLDLSR